MATIAEAQGTRLTFWAKMLIGISAFILFGFAQFAARGFVDFGRAPLVMHLHGLAMVAWLGLLVTQSLLAGRGGLALHRRLGWASAVMMPLIVVLSSLTCLAGLRLGIFPPFFTPAYFLALVHVSVVVFAAVVGVAVIRRGQPDWHKRLILGSTVLLMEPALGRVLPMPLIMPWGEWLSMAIQLGVVALVMRHDRRTLGRIHPATTAVFIIVALNHVLVEMLAIVPWWQSVAASFATA